MTTNELLEKTLARFHIHNDFLEKMFYRHDMENKVEHKDILVELKANVEQLEDLHGRLQFMMKEVGTLIK